MNQVKRVMVCAGMLLVAWQGAAAEPPIRVGAVYALTGPVAAYGVAQQKALQLKVAEINAKGGLKGRSVEAIYYDTEGNGNKAVQQLRRAIESDKVDVIIGPSTTGETLLAVPIVNAAKVPMVAHSGAQAVVDPATRYVFQTSQYDRVLVPAILREFQRRGFKRVAVLASNDGYGQSGTAVLKALSPSYGILLQIDQFDRQDTDMTAQVLRARQGNPDVLLVWSTFPAPAIILRNAKALGWSKPIYNSNAMATTDFLRQAGGLAENTFVISAPMLLPAALSATHPAKAVVTRGYEAYFAKYNEAPSPSAQHAMDAMDIVAAAVGRITGPITRDSLRDAIEKTDMLGANGRFKFSPSEHGVSGEDIPIVFLKVRKAAFTPE